MWFSFVVLLCLSVCVSVKSHLTSGASVCPKNILSRTQWATEVEKFVGYSLKPLRSRVMA